jgi:hypothetical protein
MHFNSWLDQSFAHANLTQAAMLSHHSRPAFLPGARRVKSFDSFVMMHDAFLLTKGRRPAVPVWPSWKGKKEMMMERNHFFPLTLYHRHLLKFTEKVIC